MTTASEPRRRASDWFAPGSSRDARLWLRMLAVVVVLATVAEAVARHLDLLHPAAGSLAWCCWTHAAILAAPALLIAVRAVHDRPHRSAWALLAAGLTIRAATPLLVSYADGTAPIEPADVAGVGAYVLLTVGVALLTQRDDHAHLRSLRLDGLITALSLGAVASAFWFDDLLAASGDTAGVLVDLAYPLIDLVLVVLIVAGLAPHRYRPTMSMTLLSLGVVAYTVADVVHLRDMALGTPGTGEWLVDAWMLGGLLIGVAAWAPTAYAPVRPEEVNAGIGGVPVVFATLSLGVLGLGVARDVNLVASLLALGGISVVILRTALTVHELRRANEISALARTDDLTSLTNRRGFLEGLDRLLDAAPGRVAVMVLDLNGFKDVNDSLGHHAGDDLLRLAAERFRSCVGASGLLARLGGDEFGVVAVVHDEAMATALAQALCATLDDPFVVEGTTVRVGASLGVALHPTHGKTRSAVLRCADVAMYQAKRTQSGIAVYRPTIDFTTRDQLQLLTDFRDAIAEQRLTLHYQPKVGLHDGLIAGSEALVRWEHPHRGLLFPDVFVPIAERAGLVPALTRAVLAQAISYHAEHFPDLHVSVNISHRDLVDDSLSVYIGDLLEIYRFPPEHLTLEITETALAADPFRAGRAIANLRSAGIRISIDDFGVGYSSMARLLELRVDEVKIDKSFVIAMQGDPRAVAIIKSTVELARALELGVVAEGIENIEVFKEIARCGVNVAQGYFISRALTGEDYQRFLASLATGDARSPDPTGEIATVELNQTSPTPFLPSQRRH